MKKILFLSVFLSMLISNSAFAFNDVNVNTSYKTAIEWMSDNKIITGYEDNTFKPDNCVTRAEFLKMLFLTDKADTTVPVGTAGSNYYDNMLSDVDLTSWYWPFVRTALKLNIIKGYPDGTFKPNQCVNRAEAIKMAVIESAKDNFVNDAWAGSSLMLSSYKDVDSSAWYFKYFTYVIFRNLVGQEHVKIVKNIQSDYGNDQYFYLNKSMTRKEVAEMLYRMKAMKDNNAEIFTEGDVPKDL